MIISKKIRKRMYRGIWLFGFILLLAAAFSGCGQDGSCALTKEENTFSAEIPEKDAGSEKEEAGSAPEDGEQDEPVLYIFVTGAVRKPGVYTLPEGARVYEAVEAAGGLTEEADEIYVNQAASLTDGMQLYFPTKEETAGNETHFQDSASAENTPPGGSININTADEAALQTLPGIGEAKAAAIVAYRIEHGPFARTEEIMEVSGIGEALYGKIKEKITVE